LWEWAVEVGETVDKVKVLGNREDLVEKVKALGSRAIRRGHMWMWLR